VVKNPAAIAPHHSQTQELLGFTTRSIPHLRAQRAIEKKTCFFKDSGLKLQRNMLKSILNREPMLMGFGTLL